MYKVSNNLHKKNNLPSKLCPICKRPFSWRKKWAKVWAEVKYCSALCRSRKQDTQDEV